MQQNDLVIIGGGLVGASLALCLQSAVRERGWRVKLIEPYSIEGNYQPSYDARSSAISYGSRLIYEQLGIWDKLAEKAEPITFIQVSERGHGITVNLDAKQEKVPAFGYVIDNAWIGKCLTDALDTEVIKCRYDTEVRKLTPTPEGYQITLDDDKKLAAKLVVLADGGRSDLRCQLGIYVKRTPYEQTAIIANVTPGCRHLGRAFERFTEQGPIALLPLANDNCALVLTRQHQEAERLLALPDEAFLAELQSAFGNRMGVFKQVGERHSYQLVLSEAQEQIRPHLVLLGNSAHGMHPVAGQGYNLSLRDTWALAQTLLKSDKPLGDLATLQRYMQQRKLDQRRVVGFSDQVTRLFSNNQTLLKVGRFVGLGVASTNLAPPLKHWFTLQAMGLGVHQ